MFELMGINFTVDVEELANQIADHPYGTILHLIKEIDNQVGNFDFTQMIWEWAEIEMRSRPDNG